VNHPSEAPVVLGSREQLLHLLAEAAEIEHTLMCSYLYAAFSLKRREDDGLSQVEGEAVERWRKTMMAIAVEEMGHLLMVANLTVAVGGQPHFARPNFPVSPGYFPSGVVVRLSGFSADTIDHFIFLERPLGVEGNDADDYDQAGYEREQALVGLMPSAQDYATIAHLYEATRQNLRSVAATLGEGALFVGPATAQVGARLVDLDGVAAIASLADALAAIDLIVEQGEGSPADRVDSHYTRFVGIRRELDALCVANADFAPAWPVADNPVLRQPPEPEDKIFIDESEAARMLDFACATYGLLLRILVQCFARPRAGRAADQKALFGAAFDLMHVLGSAATALARLPASTACPGINAGMSFTMLRGVEPLLRGRAEAPLLREQLTALAERSQGLVSGTAVSVLDALAAAFTLRSERPRKQKRPT
jgi:hypothetical protein